MRHTLVALLSGALLCFVYLMALCFRWASFTLDRLYVATVLGVTLSYSCVPIFYEYAVALAAGGGGGGGDGGGVSEVLVGALMSGAVNGVTGIFLLVFFVPGLGTGWMNWGLCLTTAAAVPMVLKTTLPADELKASPDVKLA